MQPPEALELTSFHPQGLSFPGPVHPLLEAICHRTTKLPSAFAYLLLLLKKVLFIYVFVAAWAFSSCGKRELLTSCGAQAAHCSGFSCSGARAQGLADCSSRGLWAQVCGSQTSEHGRSHSATCRIFLARGSNLCLLHWQAGSSPLSLQGSPPAFSFLKGALALSQELLLDTPGKTRQQAAGPTKDPLTREGGREGKQGA